MDLLLGPLISGLAHEVRSPLANINLSVELLGSLVVDEEQKMYVDIISRNSRRILDLVDELLQDQGLDEELPNPYSAQQLLDEVLELAGDRIFLKGIVVHKKYS